MIRTIGMTVGEGPPRGARSAPARMGEGWHPNRVGGAVSGAFLPPSVPTPWRSQGVNREDASGDVRAGLGIMPESAGRRGYGRPPELSLRLTYPLRR